MKIRFQIFLFQFTVFLHQSSNHQLPTGVLRGSSAFVSFQPFQVLIQFGLKKLTRDSDMYWKSKPGSIVRLNEEDWRNDDYFEEAGVDLEEVLDMRYFFSFKKGRPTQRTLALWSTKLKDFFVLYQKLS